MGQRLPSYFETIGPVRNPFCFTQRQKVTRVKETNIDFARNSTKMVSISYQAADWALERNFVGSLSTCPSAGVVVIDNARLSGRDREISSSFLERFVTDANPFLFSTKTGTAATPTK